MNLLFIGDVVGDAGCLFLKDRLYSIKRKYNVDVTIINGENSAHGNGITKNSAEYLLNIGADIITTGNHAFKRKEAGDIFDNDNILRPANYPEGCKGHGYGVFDFGRYQLAVINLMGTVYLDALDNPFAVAENIIAGLDTPNIIVDFHAEATAEKKSMGYFLAGKVSAVLGTHTHVQTSDETILSGHTGYITDTGMTGPENSVLGVCIDDAVNKLRFKTPVKFNEASGSCFMNAVLLEIDTKVGICTKIVRLVIR